MHAYVDERAAAIKRLGVESALAARRQPAAAIPGRSDEVDLAQFPALNALPKRHGLRDEPGLKVHGQNPVGRLGRVDHLARVGGIQRQRLLTEHVLPGRQRRQGGGMVDRVGSADANRVDLIQLQ